MTKTGTHTLAVGEKLVGFRHDEEQTPAGNEPRKQKIYKIITPLLHSAGSDFNEDATVVCGKEQSSALTQGPAPVAASKASSPVKAEVPAGEVVATPTEAVVEGGLGTGVLIGIIVGALVLIILIAVVIFCVMKSKNKAEHKKFS